MAVDKERARQIKSEVTAIVERLSDRVPEDTLLRMREFCYVGEWAEAVHWLCADLIKLQIPITTDEREALASALALFRRPRKHYPYTNNPQETLAALNVSSS